MPLLFNLLQAAYCNGTHHKLAFQAANHLRCQNAENWRNLLLFYHAPYLEGSKAPDKKFKDFQNHVLHVRSGNWGGAPTEARRWYERTVELLREGKWLAACYSSGILSHYLSDPLMPFHTGNSEAETNIHRAVEWSVNKSYDALQPGIDAACAKLGDLKLGRSETWLEDALTEAARHSNECYDWLIERYDFKRGAYDPPAGLDQASRLQIASLLGYAQLLHARVMDRAFDEAGVSPPEVSLGLQGIIALLDIPIAWVTRKMADSKERRLIRAMYREFKKTGKVEKHLTPDLLAIRELAPKEEEGDFGAKTAISPTPPEIPGIRPANRQTRGLAAESPVHEAPSIGQKTASRLAEIGIHTVGDLLGADPQTAANELGVRYIDAQKVRDWQDQTRLSRDLPRLRGHAAQILVGSGIRSVSDLAAAQPEEILADVAPFVESEAGSRVIKPGNEPDLREAMRWVGWAESAVQEQADEEAEVSLAN